MTISYSDKFVNLLFRWKGSLWKAIWKHLLLFLVLYYAINVLYRFVMTPEQQGHFLKYILIFDEFTKYIPLTFLLGFYVAMIVRRWWACCQLISWPDHLLFNISALIRGNDAETKIIRRTIARYAVLTSVLAWRSISLRVLMRYPTDEHLVHSGLLTREELAIFKNVQVTVDPHQKWFVPINWIQTMMVRCFEKGTLTHTNELRVLLDALEKFRNGFFQLFIYDWIAIPLVYTQVAVISVYGYFAFALIGRQYPSVNQFRQPVDLYVPIFTILQFLFYVGWLKVGEDLMFPFGADDEDFEFNYILDRNLEVSLLIVDDLHNQVPPVYVESLKDEVSLLHTKGSASLSNHPQRQHLRKYRMREGDKKIYFETNKTSIYSDGGSINKNSAVSDIIILSQILSKRYSRRVTTGKPLTRNYSLAPAVSNAPRPLHRPMELHPALLGAEHSPRQLPRAVESPSPGTLLRRNGSLPPVSRTISPSGVEIEGADQTTNYDSRDASKSASQRTLNVPDAAFMVMMCKSAPSPRGRDACGGFRVRAASINSVSPSVAASVELSDHA